MTAEQVCNVNALIQELSKIPDDGRRDECIKAARMIVYGVRLAEQNTFARQAPTLERPSV